MALFHKCRSVALHWHGWGWKKAEIYRTSKQNIKNVLLAYCSKGWNIWRTRVDLLIINNGTCSLLHFDLSVVVVSVVIIAVVIVAYAAPSKMAIHTDKSEMRIPIYKNSLQKSSYVISKWNCFHESFFHPFFRLLYWLSISCKRVATFIRWIDCSRCIQLYAKRWGNVIWIQLHEKLWPWRNGNPKKNHQKLHLTWYGFHMYVLFKAYLFSRLCCFTFSANYCEMEKLFQPLHFLFESNNFGSETHKCTRHTYEYEMRFESTADEKKYAEL